MIPWSDWLLPALIAFAAIGALWAVALFLRDVVRGPRTPRQGGAERRRPKLSDRLAEQERDTEARLQALGYSEDEVRRALEPIQTFRAIVRENEAGDERRRPGKVRGK